MIRVKKFGRLFIASVCLACAIVAAPKAVSGLYNRLCRESMVEIHPEWAGNRCDPKFPIMVTVTNHSRYPVKFVAYQLYVHPPDHSADRDGNAWYSTDQYVPPGEARALCWRITNVPDVGPDWSYELDEHGTRGYGTEREGVSPEIGF